MESRPEIRTLKPEPPPRLRLNFEVQKRIEAVQTRKTDTRDLAGFELTELPETIGNLRNLRLLQPADNRLAHLPASLADLPCLHGLDVRENPLRNLPDLPQLGRYGAYAEHFRQQKSGVIQERDYVMAAWFRRKELEFGLVK